MSPNDNVWSVHCPAAAIVTAAQWLLSASFSAFLLSFSSFFRSYCIGGCVCGDPSLIRETPFYFCGSSDPALSVWIPSGWSSSVKFRISIFLMVHISFQAAFALQIQPFINQFQPFTSNLTFYESYSTVAIFFF